MDTAKYGSEVNLQELRAQLASRVALLVVSISGPVLTLVLVVRRFPMALAGLLAVLLGMGISVRVLAKTRPTLARHLLVWGLTVALLAGMGLFAEPWLPFLGLMLMFVGAMLVSGGEFVTAGAIAVLAAWLTYGHFRPYPLPGLLAALALGMALAWLAVRTLYTALEWAWTMQQRADHLLELARDHQGELTNALKSLDMSNTILRRTQRELIAARKQAEEARLMKEQFAANVSHELRTPLNIILGFSEVMCLSPEVYGLKEWPLALRQDIHQMHRSCRHLSGMIDDVLDLSRFEMVGFTLDKQPTQLEPLLRDAIGIVEGFLRGRPVRLEAEIAPDLPSLEIDRIRIRQVLLNLLNNAHRFTEEGAIRVEAKQVGGEIVVSVSDTGPGIPADELPHLFTEFYQVDRSLQRRHGGTGLGLAISKRFVEAHDGRIWVESQEGVGSTFFFALPVPEQHIPFSRLKVDRPLEPSWPEMRSPILVVDADPAVADVVRRHVTEYEVVPVGEVDRLAEAVMLDHPRAVVWNVPPIEQRHDDVLASVSVPIIECSLPSQTWVADGLAVAACLTKPVTAERLLQEIERLGDVHDVLVVDDDRGFCRLVERMLEASGRTFKVRRAYDGEEGLHALRARRPDLLLLDMLMPGKDGFQVLEEMRQSPGLLDVPVALLTATSYAEDMLVQRGSQIVIRRPDGLGPTEVLRCLQAVVGVLEPHYDERSAPEEAPVTPET